MTIYYSKMLIFVWTDIRPKNISSYTAISVSYTCRWEGFFHVALHHWCQNYKFSTDIPYESSSRDLHDVAVKLMHIAVKLIGDVDPIFRKACLVGAISFPSGTEGWIKTHQLSTFSHLLSRVSSDSNFNDVISNVKIAISKNEDFLKNSDGYVILTKKCP